MYNETQRYESIRKKKKEQILSCFCSGSDCQEKTGPWHLLWHAGDECLFQGTMYQDIQSQNLGI